MSFDLAFENKPFAIGLGEHAPNARRERINAFDPSIAGDNIFHEMWDGSIDYAFPSSAITPTIESSDAADTSAGTGARTVLVEGLDANFVEQSETVTLSGVTPVALVNSYIRLHRATVVTAGSGGVNAGDVDVKDGSTLLLRVQIGLGRTQHCSFTVPANHKGLITGEDYAANLAFIPARFHQTDISVLSLQSSWHNGVAGFDHAVLYPIPLVVAAKVDIIIKAKAGSATACAGRVEFLLVQDS